MAAVVGRRQLTRAIECQYTKARLLVPLPLVIALTVISYLHCWLRVYGPAVAVRKIYSASTCDHGGGSGALSAGPARPHAGRAVRASRPAAAPVHAPSSHRSENRARRPRLPIRGLGRRAAPRQAGRHLSRCAAAAFLVSDRAGHPSEVVLRSTAASRRDVHAKSGIAFRPAGCSAATSPGPLRLAAAHRVGGKIAVQSLDVTQSGRFTFSCLDGTGSAAATWNTPALRVGRCKSATSPECRASRMLASAS